MRNYILYALNILKSISCLPSFLTVNFSKDSTCEYVTNGCSSLVGHSVPHGQQIKLVNHVIKIFYIFPDFFLVCFLYSLPSCVKISLYNYKLIYFFLFLSAFLYILWGYVLWYTKFIIEMYFWWIKLFTLKKQPFEKSFTFFS